MCYKSEALTPATSHCPDQTWFPKVSLNEGRGVNPGYTGVDSVFAAMAEAAQQRPRYHPRLHNKVQRDLAFAVVRSTKAEVSPPATPPAGSARGRGRVRRSTKAEVSPPATPAGAGVRALPQGSLNKGRGITPGYTRTDGQALRRCQALNKGRGITPGYTKQNPISDLAQGARSTKAEVSPPATPVACSWISRAYWALNKGRGITPGYTLGNHARDPETGLAQQRPRYHPRLHLAPEGLSWRSIARSTKAEVSPPATHGTVS